MCKYRVQAYDPFGFKKLKDVWDKLYEGKRYDLLPII